ncbi:MAG: YhbY family RNA-binding protein [Bacillota bacterium]|nr:YhbY family RNA-binding protein [Bacillota bacterium]
MLTGKQRSYLRNMANTIQPIFQVGKNGIEEAFLKQIDDALEAREILKVTVLETSGFTAREASDMICEELRCEGIQAIGRRFVIYRKSKNNPRIQIPD